MAVAKAGRAPKEFVPDYGHNVASEFELWLEDANDYMTICKVTDPAEKRSLFLNLAGLSIRRVVKGLAIPDVVGEEGDPYKAMTDAVLAHFRPSVNTTSERHKFRQLKQQGQETVTAFVGRLRAKVEACEFESTRVDTIVNGQIRDQLIVGLRDNDIRRELLKESQLTLAQAVSKAVACESSIADSSLYEEVPPPSLANKVGQSNPLSKGNAGKCRYCGCHHTRGKQHCPAAESQCSHCHKMGHFAAVCFRKTKMAVARAVDQEGLGLEADEQTNRVTEDYDTVYKTGSGQQSKHFTRTLTVNGKRCRGLLDTGATRTLITADVVAATRPSHTVLTAYDGTPVTTLGVADVTISSGNKSCTCTCFVVPTGQTVLFGQDVIIQLQLLSVADVNVVKVRPVDITVDPKATPVALPPRRHAFSLREAIEAEIKRLEERGVIESVQEATPWVSPLVPTRKANGTLRLCVDYRRLNKAIIRERHMLPTLEEITAKLEGAKVFSVLDAESGFHQIPLALDSRPYTTFASHCGLYRFKRLPFGISSAPETFQRVVSDILHGTEGVMVYIDDILVFGTSQEEHDRKLELVLRRLSNANLRLNWEKCQLRQTQVKYLGHWLTGQGIGPDADKLRAIQDMPYPTSVTDLRRFLGLATYLGKFIPRLSQITDGLRRIAKQEPFVANAELKNAYDTAKRSIATALQKLAYFRPSSLVPTAISSDASPHGLGAMLWQKDDSGQWTPVACASRSLTAAETRYSQLEREMLGVVFAITRFRQYVLGRHIQAFTDHKPLVNIVCKPFDDVPPRLQRWLVALMPYQYSLTYTPGHHLVCADALSRAPLGDQHPSPEECRSMREYVNMVLEEAPVGIDEIRRASEDDPLISSLMKRVITASWRDRNPQEEPYFLVREQLTAIDGALLFDSRYVLPENLRQPILRLAHEGHPGRDAFLDTLRTRVWWPGLTKDATAFAEQCGVCWRRRSNQEQDLQPSEVESVWHKLAIDLVSIEGHSCLSIIDYGSRYPEVIPLGSTIATAVIDKLMEVFARFGLPSVLVTDNGPQFIAAEMEQFLKQLNIRHVHSSPRYPRSNGMVERLHRVLRERLKGLRPSISFPRRLQQVLMDIRNSTHRMLGTTPSEALFGRVLLTRVPSYHHPVMVNPAHQLRAKAKMADAHDARRGVHPLPTLKPGATVILQDGRTDTTKRWRVVEQYGRQVGVSDGKRILLRNRQHVRQYNRQPEGEEQDMPQAWTQTPAPAVRAETTWNNTPTLADSEREGEITDHTPSTRSSMETCVEPSSNMTGGNSVGTGNTDPDPRSGDDLTEHRHSGRTLYKSGTVTRSGRQVKLSMKAQEADI